jgi:hypothetical protein
MTIHYTHRIKENRKTLIVYRSSWSFRDCRDFDLVRRRRWRSVVAANLWAGRDFPVSVELLLTKPSSYSYSSLTNKSKLIVRIGKTLVFMTTKRRPFSPFPRVFHTHTPRTYTHTHTHTQFFNNDPFVQSVSGREWSHTQTKLLVKNFCALGNKKRTAQQHENYSTVYHWVPESSKSLCVCVTRRRGEITAEGDPDSCAGCAPSQGESLPLVECPAAILFLLLLLHRLFLFFLLFFFTSFGLLFSNSNSRRVAHILGCFSLKEVSLDQRDYFNAMTNCCFVKMNAMPIFRIEFG